MVSIERSMIPRGMRDTGNGPGWEWWGCSWTHSEQSDSIDGKFIIFAVTHNGGGGF